mgnify:FL=1
MIISIGCDHAGYKLRETIIEWLTNSGLVENIIDYGTDSADSVDYPDYAHAVAASITDNESQMGILICGSANGISMSANKWSNIRAAVCWNNEVAKLAREHNDANVIGIPARFVTPEEAIEMVRTFLNTDFEGGRHEKRVIKINVTI